MRHVVGQFPLVRKIFFFAFIDGRPSKCRALFLDLHPTSSTSSRLLARSRPLFRSLRPILGGCGCESSRYRWTDSSSSLSVIYLDVVLSPPSSLSSFLSLSLDLSSLSLSRAPSRFPPLRREPEEPVVVVIFVVVAAFALVPCDLFQLTIASPLPPSENSGGGETLSLLLPFFRARLPSARGRNPPPRMPLLLLLLPPPRLGASQPARTPQRCPLPLQSRSIGGP